MIRSLVLAATPPPAPDPNWLPAATAQSAAALVAIIGGFVLSRLLALSTERAGLDRRLQLAEASQHLRDERATRLTAKVARKDAYDIVEDAWDDLMSADELPSATQLLGTVSPRSSETDDVVQTLEDALVAIAALKEATSAFLNTDGRSYGLKEAIADGLDVGSHSEWLASKVLDSLVEARTAEQGGIYGGLAAFKSPSAYDAQRDWNIQHEREYWADVRERDAATADAALARREVEHIRTNLLTLKPPTEMWWGLGILVFFAVVAVIAPLVILACYPTVPKHWMTAVSLGGFCIGFTVTVAYMATAMRSLTPR